MYSHSFTKLSYLYCQNVARMAAILFSRGKASSNERMHTPCFVSLLVRCSRVHQAFSLNPFV